MADSARGKKHSEESKAKISSANRGRKLTEEWKKNISLGNLGRIITPETRKKIGDANRGRKPTPEQIQQLIERNRGKPAWNKGKTGFNWGVKGERNHAWKGGVTPLYKQIRKSRQYVEWRTAVFERDDYTCVLCKTKGVTLNADHIKPFASFPELRFSVDNGRTLCVPCHRKTETWGARMCKAPPTPLT